MTATILVIDESPDVLSAIQDVLEPQGFSVLLANEGNDGVQKARYYRPDLIICDIMMPTVEGYSVITELRQIPEIAMIPFIFLATKANLSDVIGGKELEGIHILTEPFSVEEFMGAVNMRLPRD